MEWNGKHAYPPTRPGPPRVRCLGPVDRDRPAGLRPIRRELEDLLRAGETVGHEGQGALVEQFIDRLTDAIEREVQRRSRRAGSAWIVPVAALAASLPLLLAAEPGVFLLWVTLWFSVLALIVWRSL